MKRDEILKTAEKLINGPRAQDYGDAYENHKRIAEIWSIILGFKVTEEQVLLMMIGLKVARLIQTPNHQDSIIDTAGYAAALSELIEEKKNQDQTKSQPEGYLWHKN